jgi:hypothetical protein
VENTLLSTTPATRSGGYRARNPARPSSCHAREALPSRPRRTSEPVQRPSRRSSRVRCRVRKRPTRAGRAWRRECRTRLPCRGAGPAARVPFPAPRRPQRSAGAPGQVRRATAGQGCSKRSVPCGCPPRRARSSTRQPVGGGTRVVGSRHHAGRRAAAPRASVGPAASAAPPAVAHADQRRAVSTTVVDFRSAVDRPHRSDTRPDGAPGGSRTAVHASPRGAAPGSRRHRPPTSISPAARVCRRRPACRPPWQARARGAPTSAG